MVMTEMVTFFFVEKLLIFVYIDIYKMELKGKLKMNSSKRQISILENTNRQNLFKTGSTRILILYLTTILTQEALQMSL